MIARDETLRHCPVLAGFTDIGIQLLAAVARERVYPNAQALQVQGEAPRDAGAVIFLATGRVRCEVRDSDGKVLGLGSLQAGDHLGGLRLFSDTPAPVSAIAEGEVSAVLIDRPAFERLRRQKPQAAMKLLLALSADFGKRVTESASLMGDFAVFAAKRMNMQEHPQFANYADLGLDHTPTQRP